LITFGKFVFKMKNNLAIKDIEIRELQKCIAEYEDAFAFKKLFFHFFIPLKTFSYAILKSKEQAEEVVADLFVEIWAKRKKLMGIDNLKTYLYVSARNNSLRILRQTQKAKTISLDNLKVEFASIDLNAEDALIGEEVIKKVETVIEQLPQQCKLIFKLAKEDKLKYKEIAELLSISVKTIDNQLATALKKIASVIKMPQKRSIPK
jgi:RNA polymerase sigma-70 factor (family 1)